MKIEKPQTYTQAFGRKPIKSIPLHPNKIIRAKKTKMPTVVVLPDGTIQTGILAKIRDRIDNSRFMEILAEIIR